MRPGFVAASHVVTGAPWQERSDSIFQSEDSGVVGTIGAAEDRPVFSLGPVSDDRASTMRASGSEAVDCAFEGIEIEVLAIVRDHLEGLVVDVSAGCAGVHNEISWLTDAGRYDEIAEVVQTRPVRWPILEFKDIMTEQALEVLHLGSASCTRTRRWPCIMRWPDLWKLPWDFDRVVQPLAIDEQDGEQPPRLLSYPLIIWACRMDRLKPSFCSPS